MKKQRAMQLRQRHFGRGLSLSYDDPLMIVRGEGQYLFDEQGRRFLDCVNNVAHVGHCHPKVVAAASKQMAALNTNTRYLHPLLGEYLEQLTAQFPAPLSVCYLTCSGSEAVDLALRMARRVTGRDVVVALEGAYHGNTQATVDVSHYKFAGPGGAGQPANTECLSMPCALRGVFRDRQDPVAAYARELDQRLEALSDRNHRPAGLIVESMLGVGGQVMLPAGYLKSLYASMREAGGLCIADEVQVGFGRCGTHRWAFEQQEVVPDIVTLGKPIGNGHPMAAVLTTAAIAEQFDNGMEYFSTFGGNPVSCAIGLSVLEAIQEQQLQAHAKQLGTWLLNELRQLAAGFPLIADVRGSGLFIGLELVSDEQKSPAAVACHRLVQVMRQRNVLLSVDGPLHNVIKFKPPMVITQEDCEYLLEQLNEVLIEVCKESE